MGAVIGFIIGVVIGAVLGMLLTAIVIAGDDSRKTGSLDNCYNCQHMDKACEEYPCRLCKCNYLSQWEPKH